MQRRTENDKGTKKSPSLYHSMSFEKAVRDLLEEVLDEHPSLFLIDFSIDTNAGIRVTVDGDRGVVLQDCINISRHIEHNLDREEHDFSLEVTSVDATDPLVKPRQYVKNVGRKVKIKTQAGEEFEGTIRSADNDKVSLYWKAREPKLVGKGKRTVEKEKTLLYNEIVKAKIIIQFN